MPIISSSIISHAVQGNGRTRVKERHTDHLGVAHEHEYDAVVGLDINFIMEQRAINMGAAIDKREAELAEASNFELPISQVDYARRFTAQERRNIYVAKRTNEHVEDFWNMLLLAKNGVHLSAPEVMAGLVLFEQAGLIGEGRAAIIGNPND